MSEHLCERIMTLGVAHANAAGERRRQEAMA
jgi:hypothetical protein